MNQRINRRTALRLGSAALLAATLTACGVTSGTTPVPQPTTSASQPTAGSAPNTGNATAVPAATARPASRPTFAFEPRQGGPGTIVKVRGWNFAPGAPVKVRLGLPQPTGEVLVSAFADNSGLWTAQMTMPGALPSGEPIRQSDLRLVVMDDGNVALASAPFAFAPAAPAPPAGPTLEGASQAVRDMLNAFPSGQAQPFLAANLRTQAEAGKPVHQLLGLAPMAWQSFTVAPAEARGSEVLFVPATLVYSTYTEQREFTLVVENGAWRIHGSAPVGTSAPAPTPYDAQPATEPTDAVQRFLEAAQADRTGKQASVYADGNLRVVLQQGMADIGAVLREQNPFTGFSVDKIISSAPPFTYVQATLAYGAPPQPAATRIFTVKGENGLWSVTEISVAAADDPALSSEGQARNAAAQFVMLLNSGRYQEAGALFDGDMQPLLDQNPDLTGDAVGNPELRGQLLERACTVNGYACRQQRRIIAAQQTNNDEYTILMEFNNPDGNLYQHPVDGRTAFELHVQHIGGQFKVMNLLPYTS